MTTGRINQVSVIAKLCQHHTSDVRSVSHIITRFPLTRRAQSRRNRVAKCLRTRVCVADRRKRTLAARTFSDNTAHNAPTLHSDMCTDAIRRVACASALKVHTRKRSDHVQHIVSLSHPTNYPTLERQHFSAKMPSFRLPWIAAKSRSETSRILQ